MGYEWRKFVVGRLWRFILSPEVHRPEYSGMYSKEGAVQRVYSRHELRTEGFVMMFDVWTSEHEMWKRSRPR